MGRVVEIKSGHKRFETRRILAHWSSPEESISGGMAEWFKAAVLKTAVPGNWDRRFESYSLRQLHFAKE
jgi:hypothetical protein